MRNLIAPIFAAVAAIALPAAAHAVTCSTNAALSAWGQNGTNGVLSNSGVEGAIDYSGIAGQIITQNNDGNGVANVHGTATCPDAVDHTGDLLAISAALSTPVWLETGERFAVSGGLGFSGDGDTAFGGTALMRIDGGLSAFAGGAVSTNHSDLWSGKVGVRAGF